MTAVRTGGTPRPLRAAVVDDEPLIREGLAGLLAAEPGVEVIAMCAGGEEALAAVQAHRPDVLFLDVQMPGLDGLAVARALAGDAAGAGDASTAELAAVASPALVFATAHDRYALAAFDVCAVDYLLKPFDAGRVREALRRVRARLGSAAESPTGTTAAALAAQLAALAAQLGHAASGVGDSLHAAPPARWAERLVVAVPRGHRVIATRDVEWLEAADNYVTVHAADGAGLLREPLKAIEGRLDPARFARVHRSAVVNLARVRELRPLPSGDWVLTLRGGATVTLSRTHRDDVLRRLR